jgi:hypothetical protein
MLVFAEQPLTVKAVGESGETAAGDPGDDVHLIEQTALVSLRADHLGPAQKLEDTV